MSLTRLAWRSLRARPLRALLSALGVALGVAVLFAGLATNAAIERSVESTVGDLVGRSQLRVAAFDEAGLSPETQATIAGTPGVRITAPAIQLRTYLGPDIDAAATLPPPVTVIGVDPAAEPQLHQLHIVAGSMLREPAEPSAMITEQLADEDGLTLGSPLTMQGGGDRQTFRVIAILAGDGPVNGLYGRIVVVPLRVAQRVFDEAAVHRVDLGLEADADVAAVASALEDRLRLEPYVLSTPQEIAAALRGSTSEFQATTSLIAAIALFAGAFLVFNTLSMTVVEQVRSVGLLRAAGATRRQVAGFMLAQAAVLGGLGSLLGVGLGALLAAGMVAYVRTVGSVTLDRAPIPPDAIVIAFLVGFGVTIAAALEPARRAGRIQPVEALKARLDMPTARRARLRWLAGVFVVVSLVGLLVAPRGAGVVQLIVVYAILLVGTLLIPVVLPAVARVAGIPFALLLRFETRLARGSVVRDPSRTALTLGALTVGLGMIVALGGVGQHARAAAGAWIVDVLPGELMLTSIRPVAAAEGIDTEILATVPSIARISPIATFDIAVNGARADAAAVVGADLAADGRLHFTVGDREAALAAIDAGGATIVPAALAARLGLALDQVLTVPTATGQALDLRVAGIVDRSIPGSSGEAMLVGWTDATTLGVAGADAFAVRFAADAPAGARDTLRDVATTYALDVVTLDRIQGAVNDAFGRIFGLFDALAAVAVVIAALGIVNTLTMNVVERVREIGVLRAAGMTRRQVWRSVVVEAGILGLAGAILGIALGLIVGAVMVILPGGRLDVAAGIPWQVVSLTVVLGVSVAMLAAAYPARLAARLPIVKAIQFE
ncbi:MAG: FtsX-like permease family protein [Chloroflexota bacterium]